MNKDLEFASQQESTAELRLDEEGLPILEDVVDDPPRGDLALRIKAELLEELEPHLQTVVRTVFTDSVKVVALDLKRAFETQLDEALHERIEELVDQAIAKARGPEKT
jgi:hypothetical protein